MLLFNSSHKGRFGALVALSVGIAISSASPARSADDASLDSMWMDQKPATAPAPASAPTSYSAPSYTQPSYTAPNSTARTQSSTGASAPDNTTASASGESRPPLETAAPMCSFSEFKNSTLVSKGGWPGVGPFKGEGNDFADDHQNRVRLDVASDQITRAEMTLTNKQLSGNQQKDLLDMQMNVDFLLEAVGIKPRKIADFNEEMERNKDALLRNDQTPLNLVAGRYSVNLEKRAGAQGGLDYVVVVNSMDANKKVIKQHSFSDEPRKQASNGADAHYIFQETPAAPEPPPRAIKMASRPVVAPASITSDSPYTAPVSNTSKDQFANVIADWQKIKRGAVKNRQTEDLASILSGKALARQMDAIKWLITNKKFYDMNPRGVVVDQFTEIVPAKKFAVLAQVREAYKFIDEPTGKVIKEVDDVNRVNYTIEKIGGKWLITDSSLLSTASTNSKASTPNKTH